MYCTPRNASIVSLHYTILTHFIPIRYCKNILSYPTLHQIHIPEHRIHESCPTCSKPLQVSEKSCRSCRQKIGLCFLCHETVKGVFVWCPGCGHGGHLEHALEWFGGNNGDKLRELCPTGCGHRCNLIQMSQSTHGSAGGALCQEIKPKQ